MKVKLEVSDIVRRRLRGTSL